MFSLGTGRYQYLHSQRRVSTEQKYGERYPVGQPTQVAQRSSVKTSPSSFDGLVEKRTRAWASGVALGSDTCALRVSGLVTTLSDWRYWVSARTGWPIVSVL